MDLCIASCGPLISSWSTRQNPHQHCTLDKASREDILLIAGQPLGMPLIHTMPQSLALFATNCLETLFCTKTHHKIHVFGWVTHFHVSEIDHIWAKRVLALQQCNTPKQFEIRVGFSLGIFSKVIFLHYCLPMKQILII